MRNLIVLAMLALFVGLAFAYPEGEPADWNGRRQPRKTNQNQYGYPYLDESLTVEAGVWEYFYPYMVIRGGGSGLTDTLRFTGIYATIACELGAIDIELISEALVDTFTFQNPTPTGRGDGNRVRLVAPGSVGYQTWIYETLITGFRIRGVGIQSKFHWTVK